jgi:hypothetical protein
MSENENTKIKTPSNNTDEKLDAILELLKFVVKQRISNKKNRLIEEMQNRGRMNTGEVMTFLGVSRTWAIDMMKKVSEHPGFSYIGGNKETQRPTIIIYNESKVINDQMIRIKKSLDKNLILTFNEIMISLDVPINTARIIAEYFISQNKGFVIYEENKLVSKERIINGKLTRN